MININVLYQSLKAMRAFTDGPYFNIAKDTVISDIIKIPESTRTLGIDSKRFSYLYLVFPEYINDYVVNPQPKSKEEFLATDYDFENTYAGGVYDEDLGNEYAEIVENYTGLDRLYTGYEKWALTQDMFNAFFVRNNELRFFRTKTGGSLPNLYGQIYFESIQTVINTTWNIDEERYESVTTVGEYSGYVVNNFRASTSNNKEVSVNFYTDPDEYYISQHSYTTCKLRLELTDVGKVFLETAKDINSLTIQDFLVGEDNKEETIFDNTVVDLIDGVFVDRITPPDFSPPLDKRGIYNRVNFQNLNMYAWILKSFDTYQDLVDVINS